MRRTLVFLIAVGSTLLLAASASPQAEPPKPVVATTFLISGKGWGHGAGMAQWGARGFAEQEAYTYDQILAHYYPGTELKQASLAQVRVLLADGVKRLAVSSEVPFRVRDAAATTYDLPAGELALGPDLTVPLGGTQTQLLGPLVFQPGKGAFLELDGKPYRGELQVTSTGKALTAIDYVGLEQYLWGVVPGEMPGDWPPEALKAQAVAARSYALASLLKGRSFDLYADVRSQVYLGPSGEDPRTTAAVKATAGQALFFAGKPALTLFSSSSGGRTADGAEVLNRPQPYLVSVPDPYDSLSPWHRWGPVSVTAAKVRKALKLGGPVLDLKTVLGPSGRVRAVNVTTSAGGATVSGSNLRFALGLRSTWISIVTLSLQRPAGPVVYGSKTTLSGSFRGVKTVSLEARGLGAQPWTPADISPAADRTFSLVVKPAATTIYRLVAAAGGQTVLRVPVAPRVRLSQDQEPGGIGGTARPLPPGAVVEIQLLEGEQWRSVAEAVVGEKGAFRAELDAAPGTYRARVAPAGGFAEGLSPGLEIRTP